MNGLISIIVPVYNTEKYLSECIESIINQTYKNIEIILVNDGSTDNSYKICCEYAKKDDRIKVINKLNGGVSSARKVGILNAIGDYVGFVDSDDFISEKMYETMFSYIKEDIDAVISLCFSRVYNNKISEIETQIPEGIYNFENADEELYKKTLFDYQYLWSGLWKKNKMSQYLLNIDENIYYGEDSVLITQFVINASKIHYIKENLYFYRKLNPTSATSSKNYNFYFNIHCYFKSLRESLSKHKNHKLLLPLLEKKIFDFSMKSYKFVFDTIDSDSFFMFPYEKIKPDSKIIIYGIGVVGKSYYKQIRKNNYCSSVTLVDENYDKINIKNKEVFKPDKIKREEYDFVLIANKNLISSKQIARTLMDKYSVKPEKIICHEPQTLSDIIFD